MSAMFSKPKVPKAAAPKVVPMPDESQVAEARRKSMAAQQARGGRRSTILTSNDTLGA